MLNFMISEPIGKVIPIRTICELDFSEWLKTQSARIKNIVANNGFCAKPNTVCLVVDSEGNLEQVLLGVANKEDFYAFGVLPKILSAGCYQIDTTNFSSAEIYHAALGWGLGSYQFSRYKSSKEFPAKLLYQGIDGAKLSSVLGATFLVRDLINTPAGDLYPEKIAEVATKIASEYKAELKIVRGEELRREFPAVYAVGKGSAREPLLLDLRYGDSQAPKVVLVGKGVCFDSGGLQIKPSSAMQTMKKDMAGAAHVLGLAQMIMAAKLRVNLRVLIPTVENLLSGDSLKPGDIIKTRKGLAIEVANTDAEGRLILADALTLASEWQPDLILDFATLTGAARIALGPDITAIFGNNANLCKNLIAKMEEEQEPVWQMPLYQPYLEQMQSELADFKNIVTSEGFGGGAITASLFLQQFIAQGIAWAHLDMNAYNSTSRPGKPEGGEANCLRGIYNYLAVNYHS